MATAAERLIAARLEAGYPDAASAARAMGVPEPTYQAHENGSRGLARSLKRYATFFHVSADWLLTGKGDMKGRNRTIPVLGLVGAGAAVEMIGDTSGVEPPDFIDLPGDGRVAALQVRGDSQYPRFCAGEYILYDPEPVLPAALVNRYAVVQALDGRRLIKILQRGKREGSWRLVSHNAPPEEDVELLAAWRYLGVLPGK